MRSLPPEEEAVRETIHDFISSHEIFIHFFSCPAEKGSDRTALMGTWHPASVNPLTTGTLMTPCFRTELYLYHILKKKFNQRQPILSPKNENTPKRRPQKKSIPTQGNNIDGTQWKVGWVCMPLLFQFLHLDGSVQCNTRG